MADGLQKTVNFYRKRPSSFDHWRVQFMLKGVLNSYHQFHFILKDRSFSIVWSVQFNFSRPSTLDLTLLFKIKCRGHQKIITQTAAHFYQKRPSNIRRTFSFVQFDTGPFTCNQSTVQFDFSEPFTLDLIYFISWPSSTFQSSDPNGPSNLDSALLFHIQWLNN